MYTNNIIEINKETIQIARENKAKKHREKLIERGEFDPDMV